MYKGALKDAKDQMDENLMKVHLFHPAFMTKVFLPRLLKRKERSALLNVSSILG